MASPSARPSVLFDPQTLYNRFRASVRAEDKLRGYVHWLAAEKSRASQELASAAPAQAGVAPPPPLVFRAWQPGQPLAARIDMALRPGGRGQERRLELSLDLLDALQRPPTEAACRALLLERAVLSRLGQAIATAGRTPEMILSAVLCEEVVRNNLEVARLLSAVPELDGMVDARGHGTFTALALPETEPAIVEADFLPRVHVLIVIDRPRM